jgi:uncharacterized glyoxalase superfamily protein PhnB
MADHDEESIAEVFPFMRYDDVGAALAWLDKAFGFEQTKAIAGKSEGIAHGEMRVGQHVIMVDPRRAETSHLPDQGVYVYVSDIDEHYKRARAAGARILRELQETAYGSREYSARDEGGYVWSFGTYKP